MFEFLSHYLFSGLSNSRTRLDLQPSLVSQQIPYCEKEQLDQSPTYNVLRRVHEPTMNIDKNVLQNYISNVDKMKKFSSRSPNTFGKLLVHDKLQRNMRSVHDVSQGNHYTGTTAFLLERIENCTSNPQRFNPKMFETKRINILSESNASNKSIMVRRNAVIESRNGKVLRHGAGDAKHTVCANNTVDANNAVGASNTIGVNNIVTANNTVNNYEKFIGHSSEQYKIKPLLHWRNLQNNPKDVENDNKTHSSLKTKEIQDVTLLSRHNMPNLEPKNIGLKNDANFANSKDVLNNVPSIRIGIAENLSLLNNVPVLNVNEKPLKILDRDGVKRRLFVSQSSNTINVNSTNNVETSVINEPKENSAADQKFVDNHEPANSDAVKELTKNLTKILNIKELDNIKMDFIDGTKNELPDISFTKTGDKDVIGQKTDTEIIVTLTDKLEERFVENVLKDEEDNKLLPKDINDVPLEIKVHGLSDMMKDIIFETTKVVKNVDKDIVIAESSGRVELKLEEDIGSLPNDKLNLTLENVESIAEDVIILKVEDEIVKAYHGNDYQKESDIEKPKIISNDDTQSSVSSEKICANKSNAINNDSVQGIKSDAAIHTPSVEEFIIEEMNSDSVEDTAKSIEEVAKFVEDDAKSVEDVEQLVEDVAPTQEKDVANDTVLSEELIVPSSIEMSSDPSPISAPQVSDDNESFWN